MIRILFFKKRQKLNIGCSSIITLNFTRDNEAGESYSYISFETIHDTLVDIKPSAYDYTVDYLVSLEVLQADYA